MTVISEAVVDIAGLADDGEVVFYTDLRQRSGGGLVTSQRVHVRPIDGVLTTPDMVPGPARVRIGTTEYDITIPDSATAVLLWPLIDAGMPAPVGQPGFVRNAGGISRVERITESAYAQLDTPDPETLYITFPG